MPLPGGDADKAGNRYELRWTVRQFIRLLTDEVVWIELEPIGDEGDRIEFRLCRSDRRIEAHQVKRQQSGKAYWTIADLARANVLAGLRKHALDNAAEFIFVSTLPTKSLPELQDRAQAITDFPTFQKSLSLSLKGDFDDLQRRLGVDSGEETWRAVRQSRWIPVDERELDDTVHALLGAYLTGDPQAALGVLSMYSLEAVHRRVTAADLLGVLAERGIQPSDVARDRNLAARLRQCQEDYLESQEFGIGDLALPRREADQAIGILLDPDQSTRSFFLVGPAGMGKTGATGQIVRRIADTGWPILPFRLDRLDPTQRPAEIGRQLLGREKSPVAILAGLAADGDCLLVIEQLDAVSVVSGRRPEVFDAVAALVREARVHANMRLLLVCRAFDLENDARLRDLREQEKTRATTISVGPLDQEQVKQVVAHLDLPPEQFTPSQIELLRLPLNLAILAGVTAGNDGEPFGFSSAKDLYDTFWRRKRSDLLQVLSDHNAFEVLLYALCEAMNERQTLSVPRGCLPPGDADLDRLVSADVCARQGSRIGFFHEGFFDYVFARRFSETGEPLLNLLRSAEQDLFRRSQVRQILAYRRDDDFDAYLRDLGDCLAAPDVRFHIKKLMIGVVGQVSDPRPEEWEILEGQSGEQTARPTDPVQTALWSSAPWFRFLHDQGVLTGWLASERPAIINFGFNWLGHIAKLEPDRVADLLEGQAGASPERDEHVLGVLYRHDAAAESERLEALFYRLATQPGRNWAFVCGAFKTFIHSHCYRGSRG
ncbi:hypothetical protein ABC977_17865, partial [Thioalkalicoccus limnaeus]